MTRARQRALPATVAFAVVAALAAPCSSSAFPSELRVSQLASSTYLSPGGSRSLTAAGTPKNAVRFHGRVTAIDPETRRRMVGSSWHRGCPVGLSELRVLRVRHWSFDGSVHWGRLVVNRDAAKAMLGAMRRLFRLHFPIRQMRLVDTYGADDHRSMAADNTSAFNCRFIAGQPGVWSEHAYGRAIDVNPIENPYVTGSGHVSPPAGAPYANRGHHTPGMVHRRGPAVEAFAAAGWEWGGNWEWPKDYQHFSATGH